MHPPSSPAGKILVKGAGMFTIEGTLLVRYNSKEHGVTIPDGVQTIGD